MKEKIYNDVVSIANKYKADKYTDESTITVTISFEKFIEMDRLIKIGEATEKAYSEGAFMIYDIVENHELHIVQYNADGTIEQLLEWAKNN